LAREVEVVLSGARNRRFINTDDYSCSIHAHTKIADFHGRRGSVPGSSTGIRGLRPVLNEILRDIFLFIEEDVMMLSGIGPQPLPSNY
jgi:hypothetical protein